MGFQEQSRSPLKIAAFTEYAWENALPVLRIVGPLSSFGGELIRGVEEGKIFPERVSQADLVVVQREFPRNQEMFSQIVERARAENKPVVLDLDDLLLDLPENHPDRLTHHYTSALFPLAQAIVDADAVTTSSIRLQEILRQFNPNTWILPNTLNDSLWVFREPSPWSQNVSSIRSDRPVVIGYIGGDSHAPDLESVAPSLARILEKYGNGLHLRFYGLNPPSLLKGFAGVKWIPLAEVNYARYADFVLAQDCDLYIAPLVENLFNHCKSPIKFLEYSATATPGVYSRVAPYEEVVRHGENGFLASNPGEWEESLSRLIESSALRTEIGLRAQQTVRENWLLSQHGGEWMETIKRICAHQGAPRGVLAPEMKIMLGIWRQVEAFYQSRLAEREKTVEALTQRAAAAERALSQAAGRLDEIERSKAWRVGRIQPIETEM